MNSRSNRSQKSRILTAVAVFGIVVATGTGVAAACGGGGGRGEDRKSQDWSAPKPVATWSAPTKVVDDRAFYDEDDWKFTDADEAIAAAADDDDVVIEDEATESESTGSGFQVDVSNITYDEEDSSTPPDVTADSPTYTGSNPDEYYKGLFQDLVSELGSDAGKYESQLTQEQRSTGYELKYNSLKAVVEADQ